ncbi:MAG TPA: SAVMC3_10250 family protein [Nitrososphaeraceae archaeon]
MKYYIYISDTKIDMLFAQIPQSILKKISAELNINLGMVSVSLKEKQSEQTRFDKVNVVSNYINEHLDVGDTDHPKAYFKGIVPMVWGPLPHGGPDNDFVYFGGETNNTILGLGGSKHHVIGEVKGESHSVGGSMAYAIDEYLKRVNKPSPDDKLHSGFDYEKSSLYDLKWTTSIMNGPPQFLDFLARKLVEDTIALNTWDDKSPKKHALLGSPIYVAYAD